MAIGDHAEVVKLNQLSDGVSPGARIAMPVSRNAAIPMCNHNAAITMPVSQCPYHNAAIPMCNHNAAITMPVSRNAAIPMCRIPQSRNAANHQPSAVAHDSDALSY